MFAKQFRRKISSVVSTEVTIPVPWGNIAGKQWTNSEMIDHQGQENDSYGSGNNELCLVKPWIVLHGWLDNAGSFDTLAPMLVSSCPQHSLLCIDYPGHGLSSHIAPGHMYHYLESMRYIKLVASHMGLDKFGLMGHSMGAGMSSLFAATFPEMVEALVMIDLVKPVGRRTENLIENTREAVNTFLAIEMKLSKGSEKTYKTEEEAFNRLQDGARYDLTIVYIFLSYFKTFRVLQGEGAVTDESLRLIMKRGVKKCEGGFTFTRDLRHKARSLYGLSDEVCEVFAKSIKCPHLLIKASDSPHYEDDIIMKRTLETYSQNPGFDMVTIEGSHHVHLNNPERLMPHLEKFIGNHL